MNNPRYNVDDLVLVAPRDGTNIESLGKVMKVEYTIFNSGWRYKVRLMNGRIIWQDQEWLAPRPKQKELL